MEKPVSCRAHLPGESLAPSPAGWATYQQVLSELVKTAQALQQEKVIAGTRYSKRQDDYRRAAWQAFFQFKERYVDLRPPHAGTIHRSQGSTYDIAYLDLTDIGRNTKWYEIAKLLYVGLTRPRYAVIATGTLPARLYEPARGTGPRRRGAGTAYPRDTGPNPGNLVMSQARQRQRAGRGQPAPRLTSRFLESRVSEFTNAKFAQRLGFPLTQPIGFLVFETTLGEKTVYCCLAGGYLDRKGEVWFTAVGRAAFEALLRLPTTTEPVILRELKLGRVPPTAKSGRPWKWRRRVPAFVFLAIWLTNWMV